MIRTPISGRAALVGIALTLGLAAPLFSQSPPGPPEGWVLFDDMYLPDPDQGGDSAFQATAWPGGFVPYTFNSSLLADQQTAALQAMTEVAGASFVTFLPRTTQLNWIEFHATTFNSSVVGMVGGGQTINITSWGSRYTIVHEIMHALGFVHEHGRPDRAGFVNVNSQNVQSGQEHNFQVQGMATTATPYDFLSIMHYSRNTFSSNGLDTLTPQAPFLQFLNDTATSPGMGNRTFLSTGDAAGLQQRYGSAPAPTLTGISPTTATTSGAPLTVHAFGARFFQGSPNANGVQGTKIRWNGILLPTTWVDATHVTASVPASLFATPHIAQISVINAAPGGGPSANLSLQVNCQTGTLVLAPNVPTQTTNGCQVFAIGPPAQSAFNVVAVSSPANWDITMGTATSAEPGNACDFVVGSGFFGSGTVLPNTGNATLNGAFTATLQYAVSTPMSNGTPTISVLPAGHVVKALHYSSGPGVSFNSITVAGPTELRWKLIWEGNTFAWRSSTGNTVIAQGQVGGSPVQHYGLVPGNFCLVVYRDGGPAPTAQSFTVTQCFDFTPVALTPGNSLVTLNPNACVWFDVVAPLSGAWNVVGVSAQSDWDIQIGPAVSQTGGTGADYVLANGHLGSIGPLTGVAAPFVPPGALGALQFGATVSLASVPGAAAGFTPLFLAYDIFIPAPGNYDFSVTAPGSSWDLHRPGPNSAWRPAAARAFGPFVASAMPVTVQNLDAGWHCAVIYRNGGPAAANAFTSVSIAPSILQPATLAALTPNGVSANGGPVTVVASGNGFIAGSEVRWNGAPLPTTFVSATALQTTVANALLAGPGTALVTVATPGGGMSGALFFTIGNAIPVLTGLSHLQVIAGSPTLALSAYGSDFAPGAVIRWNGVPLTTSFVSTTQLDTVVDASLLAAPLYNAVNIANPAPVEAESAFSYVSVFNAHISYLAPESASISSPGSPPLAVSLVGIQFAPWSVVYANGVALPTTYVDFNHLNATLDPGDVLQATRPGAVGICVVNTSASVSNLLPIAIGSGGNNAGLIRTQPANPGPGSPFSLLIEGGPPQGPLTLFVDFGNPTPIAHWPSAAFDWVLGVTEYAGSSGAWLVVGDGMGLLGAADGTAFDVVGSYVVPGLMMPPQLLNLQLTLQGIYFDSTSPIGVGMTWPLHTFRF